MLSIGRPCLTQLCNLRAMWYAYSMPRGLGWNSSQDIAWACPSVFLFFPIFFFSLMNNQGFAFGVGVQQALQNNPQCSDCTLKSKASRDQAAHLRDLELDNTLHPFHKCTIIRRGIQPQAVQIPLNPLYSPLHSLATLTIPREISASPKFEALAVRGGRIFRSNHVCASGGPWRPLEPPRTAWKRLENPHMHGVTSTAPNLNYGLQYIQ